MAEGDPKDLGGGAAQPLGPNAGTVAKPLWGVLSLQNVSLLVFTGLSVAIAIISVTAIAFPNGNIGDPFAISRTLAVLLIAALACAAMAWLDNTNAVILGRGLKNLLSIQRAAVAAFAVSAVATIGISIFVALTSLFSGELKRGVYALQAIEFLLKLTAVSAIIVLITLRKPSVKRTTVTQTTAPAESVQGEAVVVAAEDEEEERGRLEYGSLAFAFSLVVIAGLIVPSEDLMRLASMFFGDAKKIEDYLPQRPLVSVDDDLADRVVDAIEGAPEMSAILADMGEANRQGLIVGLRSQIESVLYDVVVDGVRRIGAWPLLEDICYDRADATIFSNSDDKLLAEHLTYLAAEGLVQYPYGDINALSLTSYGRIVLSKAANRECVFTVAQATTAPSVSSDRPAFSPRPRQITITGSEPVIAEIPHERALELSSGGNNFKIALQGGQYRVELVSAGRVDPFLQLFDANGVLVAENDDGGPGVFDSAITFTVSDTEPYYVRATSLDGRQGSAIIRVNDAAVVAEPVGDSDPAALAILDRAASIPLAATAQVPPDGAAFHFRALQSGQHAINTLPRTNVENEDLVAVLYAVSGSEQIQIASDDDDGPGDLPALSAELSEGDTYVLVLRHFANGSSTTSVAVDIYPEVTTTDASGQQLLLNPETPVEDAASAPLTDSAGSQSGQ